MTEGPRTSILAHDKSLNKNNKCSSAPQSAGKLVCRISTTAKTMCFRGMERCELIELLRPWHVETSHRLSCKSLWLVGPWLVRVGCHSFATCLGVSRWSSVAPCLIPLQALTVSFSHVFPFREQIREESTICTVLGHAFTA